MPNLTTTFRDVEAADKVLGLHRVTDRAVSAGYLAPDDARQWLDHLASAPFFASAKAFIIVATTSAAPR